MQRLTVQTYGPEAARHIGTLKRHAERVVTRGNGARVIGVIDAPPIDLQSGRLEGRPPLADILSAIAQAAGQHRPLNGEGGFARDRFTGIRGTLQIAERLDDLVPLLETRAAMLHPTADGPAVLAGVWNTRLLEAYLRTKGISAHSMNPLDAGLRVSQGKESEGRMQLSPDQDAEIALRLMAQLGRSEAKVLLIDPFAYDREGAIRTLPSRTGHEIAMAVVRALDANEIQVYA